MASFYYSTEAQVIVDGQDGNQSYKNDVQQYQTGDQNEVPTQSDCQEDECTYSGTTR